MDWFNTVDLSVQDVFLHPVPSCYFTSSNGTTQSHAIVVMKFSLIPNYASDFQGQCKTMSITSHASESKTRISH